MSFRDREKKRQVALKKQLFSKAACNSGTYKGKMYGFCLDDFSSQENIHKCIRKSALEYFDQRNIGWHDGKIIGGQNKLPSNHLCCSQSFCVNVFFPYILRPDLLKNILIQMGYDVNKVLPFIDDTPLEGGKHSFVCFEWIGNKNYLKERSRGRIAADNERSRGKGFTSSDIAIRYLDNNNKIHIILGEWKYTEKYGNSNLRYSDSGTDRFKEIYSEFLKDPDCPIRLSNHKEYEFLFFDPFDQMMRAQLLARSMEKYREMDADFVSFLHIVPRANHELLEKITSPGLANYGEDIHEIWGNIVTKGNFKGFYTEDLIDIVTLNAPLKEWSNYIKKRYGGMK